MAAEIREAYPEAAIELIPSEGGRFEVLRDGEAIYRKSETGRHTKPGEIIGLLGSSAA